MLTNNFYLLQTVATLRTAISGKAVKPDGSTVDLTGPTVNSYFPYALYRYPVFRKDYNDMGVCVGNGSTPAAKSDYQLESIISDGLTSLSYTNAVNILDNGYEVVSAYILQNTSATDITISEIGLMGRGYVDSSQTAFLVDRTVLDAPITIPAGETKTISYTIRINYPA